MTFLNGCMPVFPAWQQSPIKAMEEHFLNSRENIPCQLLGSGCAVDLHPSAFIAGSVRAVTQFAHVPCHLTSLEDEIFEMSIPRSYSAHIAKWIGEKPPRGNGGF